MSEKPLESYEKKSKINCIVSGIIFIVIGAAIFIGFFIGLNNSNTLDITAIVMISFLSLIFILIGVLQLTAKLRERRREADIATPGTRANRQYEEKRAKAIEKQNKKLYVHGDTKDELYNRKLKNSTICAVIAAAVGILFFIISLNENDTEFLFFGIVSFGIGIGVISYSLYGSGLRKIKDIITKLGLNYDSVNEDFVGGKCFKFNGKILCIGKRYTVYSDGASSIIFDNSDICGIAPHRQDIYHYKNLVYTGKKSNYYVAVTLKNGVTHYLSCRQFVDEMIIEEYLSQNRNSI
ncbi:MAG TPA: hypothetical protein PKI60_04580 [Oscillospiraceae bacterium]|nr:hypothetical protein [Oscillospiraceae bacterium]